jgi:uncharacterized cupredoxin-like copper-binding protein
MRTSILLGAVCAAMLFAAGCGSSNDDKSSDTGAVPAATTETQADTETTPAATSGGGSGEKLKVSADPGGALKFDKSDLTAKAGKVTITMDNPSSLPHAIAVEGKGVDMDGETVGKGGTSTVTVDLKPGKYEFYCPVDGHKDAGMEGDLTVS